MKTKTLRTQSMLMGVLLGTGFLCLCMGTARANSTDYLQPAAAVIYEEDLTVNGTGRFNSI